MRISWTTSELKENVLTLLALLWGILLILPGNTFADPSGLSNSLGVYARDWVWGLLVLLVTVPFMLLPKNRHIGFRKFAHAFYWVFWSGIFFLAIFRSVVSNGLQSYDLLIPSVFLTIALLHAIFYVGLWRKP